VIDPEHLSSLFGGSVKPKLATEKVNIHKEKEKALEWLAFEKKKFDIEVLRQNLTSQIQTTVNNIKKDQQDIMNEEQRQTRSLQKIDQLESDLRTTKT
jgi:primosomal protein N''